jgi:hypothetical protein
MIKILVKIFRRLENFERNYSRIFWFCISFLGFFLFHEPIQNPSQSQVGIEQVRGRAKDSEKIKNFEPTFHRRLEKYFPDWEERIAYKKSQTEFYKSAMRKKKEIIKLRMVDDLNFYSEKELDAINYFKGKSFYARCQDPSVAPNIYDTRQSFLLKMHDISFREKFLQSFNRINN